MDMTCDVLVVGGGVAGAAAAIAAARGGARTMLIEKEEYLGGTGYAGMFQHICGLYLNGETMPVETLNGGISGEIATGLIQAVPGTVVKRIGRVYVLPYDRECLQTVLTMLCRDETRLTVLLQNRMMAVDRNEKTIASVEIEGQDGPHTIIPGVLIDCSGSADAAALAGAEYELATSGDRQLAGYTVFIRGLRDADETLSIRVPYHLAQAVEQSKLQRVARLTTFSIGSEEGEGYLKISALPEQSDKDTQKESAAVLQYLASVLPAFRDASAVSTSRVLEREGRRVTGEYTLTRDDVLNARKFSDGVVKNAWPIELWDRAKGVVYHYVPKDDYYDIPFRCLTVKGISNMLTAGRCISVTHEALGSTRVMGTCIALGEQAGKAAAYWIQRGKFPEISE